MTKTHERSTHDTAESVTSRILEWFFPYQRTYFQDASPKKIVLKARQIGYSEVAVAEAVYHCATHPGHTFYLVKQTRESAGKELLSRAKNRWIKVFQKIPALRDQMQITHSNQHEVIFQNGSRLAAISNDPIKLRGEVASFLFDEIDFYEDRVLDALPDAVFPTIDNPLNPDCIIRMVSTPYVEGRLYQKIWEDPNGAYQDWSRHYCDIHKAVDDGFPIDIEALKARYVATPSKYTREYLCQWVSAEHFYFDKSILAELGISELPEGAVYAGIDVGKVNDYTALIFLIGTDEGYVSGDYYLIRHISYEDIAQIVAEKLLDYGASKAHVDETNNAAFLDSLKAKIKVETKKRQEVEENQQEVEDRQEDSDGEEKIKPPKITGRTFTNQWKHDVISDLTRLVEKEEIRFCFDKGLEWSAAHTRFRRTPTPVLLEDMSNLVQSSTRSGKPKYDVERTEDGHGDAFFALLLALDASQSRASIVWDI